MSDVFFLGIDIGSVSVKTALVLPDGTLAAETYSRIKGDPLTTLLADLSAHFRSFPESLIRAAGITGSGGKQVADALGAVFVNEILAQATFVGQFHPEARTVVELGGEDAKLISLRIDNASGGVKIEDFAMNTACAAGTGSFLDQQATRLALTIEDFGARALLSRNPPTVAGRCSVFAKSDMIHLQQIATPDHDIVAGLCFAMARNFKATVGKGKTFHSPVLFLGGVAANPGMRRAFREVLGLGGSEFFAPEHFNTAGAAGAALVARDGRSGAAFRGLGGLREFMARQAASWNGMMQLTAPRHVMPNPASDAAPGNDGLIEAFLGVDVGSVSTNVVVIDRQMRVLSKRYLPTAGRPIEAVKQGLAEVGGEIGPRVKILAAGTTGSGRYLTGDMIGADVVRNEITAQATAAAAIDPAVDTIFEIGGQDSKFISLQQGAVVDFEMNKACAAGTGSFLEEQAERLGISIKEEFARRALRSPSPCGLGERCTVFMESDLVHYLNKGAGVDDLTAGLAYSIVHNYLNKVVAGKKVGERIFFQGGVAANDAVVSAFETVTGKRITVPPHHEVTGAIGAAVLAMRARPQGPSAFKGFDLAKRHYTISTFECHECSNRCDIRKVSFDGEAPLFYGSRCEKYDVKKKAGSPLRLPDLFAERDRMLTGSGEAPGGADGPVIGIPRMLFLNDFLPFWRTFFAALGFRVVVSERTNRTIIAKGLEAAAAESCFPSRAALGHIRELLEQDVDYLFLPSYIRFPSSVDESGAQACPYVQAMPYLARASLGFGAAKVLEPRLFLQDERHARRSIAALGAALDKSRNDVERARKAAEKAQAEFNRSLAERGREVLAGLGRGEKALVLIGRSYNTTDTGMNMNLPAKIRDLGVQAVPLDFLPLNEAALAGWEDMYWRSGQRLLAMARYLKEHPNLYPVYITNFGCGPDSFISHFFREEMGDKPFLQLEIDEHSADAGAVTRIEAFLDSIANVRSTDSAPFAIKRHTTVARRKVFLPPMADHAYALAAAFRACGVDTEVLPESDDETVRIGKEHSSGRECFPLALTVGDMIKAARRPGFDPERSAFFMPGGKGPCRFGQYHLYHRHVLDRIGLPDVPVYSPMQDETVHRDTGMVGRDFVRLIWRGALAVDMLQKALFEHRPHEKKKGEANLVYQESLARLVTAIEQRNDIRPALRRAYRDFMDVEISERTKPVIGIVGEIYVRSNRFSNEDVIRQVEALGGEAWLAPVSEWLLYVTETSKASARMKRAWKGLVKAHLTDWVQRRDESALLHTFNGTLRSLHEPSIKRTLRTARPYLHHSFEGEAVLSVGKAIDYIKRGVSGIVNVMPLSCMPGTIASAVLKRVREEHGNIPLLSIAYEGQKDSQTLTRLEAFMHQARGYREAKGEKKS